VAGRVLLVDDVHTTGATLSAAARVLRSAGADAVVAVTLARADDH
jgi:predicted amidophosphoribosyltransferase